MLISDIFARPSFLVVICAGSYAAATLAMKASSHLPSVTNLSIIAFCLGIAAFAEIVLMRRFDIGVAYIAILVGETMLVLIAAFMIGEGLGPTQILGAFLVLSGAVLVTN